MLLLLDILVNSYLGIFSSFVIGYIIYFNKYSFLCLLFLDILFNKIPIISCIIFILHLVNKYIFKYLVKNKINYFIFSIIYYLLFMLIIYLVRDYNFSFRYYVSINYVAFLYNIVFYILYIFYKNKVIIKKYKIR